MQVVYNIFDQNPEDELFPMCRELGVAVIARVPFDEGSLTGTMTRDMTWPDGDWRNLYFTPDKLAATLDRVDALTSDVPPGMTHAGAGAAVHPGVAGRDARSFPGCAGSGTSKPIFRCRMAGPSRQKSWNGCGSTGGSGITSWCEGRLRGLGLEAWRPGGLEA